MSKRDDWIDYFELLHGRKPNADEYLEAKNAGKFDSSPNNTDQSVQGQSSPQEAPSVEQYDVAETSDFNDWFASEHLHEQTNIVGEGPKQDYQEAATPNYYHTQTNMGGEDPSPNKIIKEMQFPIITILLKINMPPLFSLINVDKRLPLGEHLLIISEVTGLLMALRPEKAIGQSYSLI